MVIPLIIAVHIFPARGIVVLAGVHPREHGNGWAGTNKGVAVLPLPDAHSVDGHIVAVVVCSIGGRASMDKGKVDGAASVCREVYGAPIPHTVASLAIKGVGKIAQVDISVRIHHILGRRHQEVVGGVVASGIPG